MNGKVGCLRHQTFYDFRAHFVVYSPTGYTKDLHLFFSQPDIHVTGNLFQHSSQYIKKPNYVITSPEVGPKLIQKRKLPGSIFTNKLAVTNQVKSAHLSTAEMYLYTIIVQVAAHYRWGIKWVFKCNYNFRFYQCTYIRRSICMRGPS